MPALPLGSAPLDDGESGPYGCRHKLLLRNRYLRYIPDDDVDPDECLRDDLCAGGRGCEAVDGLASVLIGGEGDQCPAPLSDPRSPEGDELSRLALTQPQDGELVLQERGGCFRLDDEALVLSEGGGLLPSQNSDG